MVVGCSCPADGSRFCDWCTSLAQRAGVVLVAGVPVEMRSTTQATSGIRVTSKRNPGRSRTKESQLVHDGMLPQVTLTLPYPPSVNHMWRHTHGRTLLSKPGRIYRTQVADVVIRAWPHQVPKLWTGRLGVTIECCMPDQRKRDLDNAQKAVLDSLQHALVYVDDSQIDDLHIWRGPLDRPKGHVEVTLRAL